MIEQFGQCRARGFTLIELLVAMVLGLLVIAAVAAIFLSGSRNYREDERLARMHDSVRFALTEISHEIEMGGHWGESFSPPSVLDASLGAAAMATSGNDCGAGTAQWAFSTDRPVELLDNVTGATAHTNFNCIAAAEIQAGTDIVSVKRLAGSPSVPAAGNVGQVFYRTNNSTGVLYKHAAGPDASLVPPGITTDWAYRVTIYFIRNYFVTAGDGIPSLCRKRLLVDSGGAPTLQTEDGGCIPGIENLQVEAGVDSASDGIANFYVSSPSAANMDSMVSVKLYLLAKTEQTLPHYSNPKTYTLGNAPAFTPADRHPRELVEAMAVLRNPASMRRFK